jgi:hypothetical protein
MMCPVRSDRSPWEGLTIVRSLSFVLTPELTCDLSIDLAETELAGARAVAILFEGVFQLRLSDLGGGVSQILDLAVEDVSSWQWDRLKYRVDGDKISFLCRDYSIVREYTT